MTNLARTPKSAIFWDFAKGGPTENAQKSRPTIGASKTPCRKWHHLLITMQNVSMHLKCKHRTTLFCKLRLHKCPYSRVMTNLARTPKSAIFWDFAKGGPRENAQKSRPTIGASKTPWRKWPIYLLISITHLKANIGHSLQQNVVLCLHFKCILIMTMPFAPGSPYSRPTFLRFCLGPPLAKSQKMADLGVRQICHNSAYGHLWSRSLQQNVVLCLHFKCILIRRWCHLRQGVFEAPIVGLLFEHFPLVPPWQNLRKWPI